MVFNSEFLLRFHHSDPGGVIFFAKALEISHEIFEDFVTKGLSMPWTFWFQNPSWIVPIVHCRADFRRPVFAGKKYSVELTVTEIKKTSFATRMCFLEEGELSIETQLSHIFLNRESREKLLIPSGVREKLSGFYK